MAEAKTGKVYIVNFQDKIDFTSAERFGELVYITQGFLNLRNLGKLREKFTRYIELSAPTDFLILTGPAVVNTLVVMLWFVKHGYVNILSWDNRDSCYMHNVVGMSEDKRITLE